MIRNIRFYNSRFKCECDNKVDENMIYSYCSFLSNSCRFMISIMLGPNLILTKFCTFLLFEIKQVHIETQPLLPPSLRCHLLTVFYLSVSQILFCHHVVTYMSNLECFAILHSLFLDND